MEQAIGITSKLSQTFTKWFGFAFRVRILYIVFAFILLNSIIIGIQEKNANPVIDELGERFLTPTLKFQEFSLEVIENGGLYHKTPNTLSAILKFLYNLWELFSQFWIILMWISLLTNLLTTVWLKNTAQKPIAFTAALVTFLFIQVIYIGFKFPELNPMQPILAFRDFVTAVPYFFKSFAEVGDVVKNNSTIVNRII